MLDAGQVLTPGTVHVAVGFTDLGSLAASVQLWPDAGDPQLHGKTLRCEWECE